MRRHRCRARASSDVVAKFVHAIHKQNRNEQAAARNFDEAAAAAPAFADKRRRLRTRNDDLRACRIHGTHF